MYELAHRGLSKSYPENTMLAFTRALEAGFDGIETDVQMTRDGVLVLCHDEKINRTSTGKGYLKDYTYQQLLQYNFNYKFDTQVTIPTLDELLELIAGTHKILNLEIKDTKSEGIERAIALAVKQHHLEDQVVFSSVSLESLIKIRRFLPASYVALIVSGRYKKRRLDPVTFHLDGIHVKYSKLNEKELQYFKEHHIAVGAWTITREKDFQFFRSHDILFVFTNEKMK
ncbi:glycerophosphodiester phosphodiesterase family protein [Intestinibaculum porci]|uniref:glycerophosphodiester phosphodiesterase family protein n=1 Tax=Intestinibaculum porci TaxID=2487118 RepID=UPI002408F635|nr:glycerophosphodiester phosphodiesterase family protein [Intestinibaculum porci]MDD6349421.1 glycerophosphodiester phosphodiesterase family protein [Intestinibaculum porci]